MKTVCVWNFELKRITLAVTASCVLIKDKLFLVFFVFYSEFFIYFFFFGFGKSFFFTLAHQDFLSLILIFTLFILLSVLDWAGNAVKAAAAEAAQSNIAKYDDDDEFYLSFLPKLDALFLLNLCAFKWRGKNASFRC